MGRTGEKKRRAQLAADIKLFNIACRLMNRMKERHTVEMANAEQKLLAAKDALARLEVDEEIHVRALGQKLKEIEGLERELAAVVRERDEARSLLEKAYLAERHPS